MITIEFLLPIFLTPLKINYIPEDYQNVIKLYFLGRIQNY